MKYSIVIPTFNHCDDLLIPCIDSIQKFSEMGDVELVIVANGCTDNTIAYLHTLTHLNLQLVWTTEALGYTKATNLGIRQATGDYVVLMNNDLVLLEQPQNQWLEMLRAPFDSGKVGVTGPVKFDWDCGGNIYECMAFWLVMMRRELFSEIGILDEIYSPGMGEDGDFCIRATRAGYSLVGVPHDIKGHFDTGLVSQQFPIYHVGNGTFNDNSTEKNAVIARNNIILADKYGQKNISIVVPVYAPTDLHVNTLRQCVESIFAYTDMTDKELIVVANGCTDDTRSYLDSLGPKIKYIWMENPEGYIRAVNAGIDVCRGKYVILVDADTVLLPHPFNGWIETLQKPFNEQPLVGASGPCANDYPNMGLVIHSNCTMYNTVLLRELGKFDEIYNPGYLSDSDVSLKIWKAGYSCVEVPVDRANKEYINGVFTIDFPLYHTGESKVMDKQKDVKIIEKNWQLLCARYKKKKKYSIVIPTYNHCDDLLKPCLDSILEFTDIGDLEIIVVANGCVDNTREYLSSSTLPMKVVWFDQGIGYTRATNEGIKVSTGEYVILLNNDTQFLGQVKNDWINRLVAPFEDPKMGVTGVLELFDESAESTFLVFFCVMIKRTLFDEIGILDEIFSPGYGEDIDFCIRAIRAGYECKGVNTVFYQDTLKCTTFPIWHKNNQTFGEIPEYGSEIVVRNSKVLKQRYGKKMKKYSIVIPTYNHCEDLLKPLCESIKKYTDPSSIEVLIVANGCVDDTRVYVESLGPPFRLIWSAEAIGYTKATNLGIKECQGEYVVLLNNDTELLPQEQNQWLNMMSEKFTDKVGMVGPLELFDTYSNHHVMIFFCVMIRKAIFDEIGILDEIYSPGGGEDIDFTIRVKQAGYTSVAIASSFKPEASTNVGNVPIWHKDNQTFKDIPEYSQIVIKQNGLLNCRRYNNNLKLNIGAGGIDVPGFLSVDLYDKRALIKMDITKLEFADNTVTELMASHVFEHLNPYHSVDILKDWLRVLKPGGKLSMEMPDIEKCCRSFLENKDYYARMGVANVIYGSVNTTGEGGPDNITAPHLFGWWPESMYNHLAAAGYTDISFPSEQWPHPGDNFRVEAYKPAMTINRDSLLAQEPLTYEEIFVQNSYGIETDDIRGKQVVDVGGNLGMFALACVEKGAGQIVCVEAQPVIYNLGLLNNINAYPMIIPLNYAVSDEDGKQVHILNEHVGSKVGGDIGELVETITLETLLYQYNLLGDDLVLKLDCEGSEFDIMMGTPIEIIRRFRTIFIEMHNNTNPHPAYRDSSVVINRLQECGFNKVKDGGMVVYNEDGTTTSLGVFVQKWARV